MNKPHNSEEIIAIVDDSDVVIGKYPRKCPRDLLNLYEFILKKRID